MTEKIDPKLLEKYLEGASLSKEELLTVESVLAMDEVTASEIASKLKEIPLTETLKKGIQKAGEVDLKKKINALENSLISKGFFLDEAAIHEYLKGTLKGEALVIFENRLQQDTAFTQRVEKEQVLLMGLKKAGQNQLKDKLAKIQEGLAEKGFFEEKKEETTNPTESAKVVSIFKRRNLAIAASLLILVLAYFNYSNSASVDIDQIFANHFPYQDKISESIKDEISEIGYTASDKAVQEQLLAALASYNQQKYKEAIPLFNEILVQQPNQLYAKIYLGQSHLNLKNWTEATQLLQPLGENMDFPLRADALWGTAFSLLKQEKNQAAKSSLQQISQFENPYQAAAIELLTVL